jgi:hypothetical protein
MTLAKDWVEKNIPPGSAILLDEYGPPLVEGPSRIRAEAERKFLDGARFAYHKKRALFYQVREEVAGEAVSYNLSYIRHPIGYLEGEAGYEREMAESLAALENYRTKYEFLIVSDAQLEKYARYQISEIPERYRKIKGFYEELQGLLPMRVFSPREGYVRGPTIKIFKLRNS